MTTTVYGGYQHTIFIYIYERNERNERKLLCLILNAERNTKEIRKKYLRGLHALLPRLPHYLKLTTHNTTEDSQP